MLVFPWLMLFIAVVELRGEKEVREERGDDEDDDEDDDGVTVATSFGLSEGWLELEPLGMIRRELAFILAVELGASHTFF